MKQTIEVGVTRLWTKHGAGHLCECQTWRERHGFEQQTPATCFATPSFLFAEPVLPAGDAGGRAEALRYR